ncbi:MAG: esterase-like activity of phytase family protein [Pseudorhodoplanes sp.]
MSLARAGLRDAGRRAKSLFALSAALALFVLAGLSPLAAEPPVASVQRIEVRAVPIPSFDPGNPERRRFGALAFLGGIELSSPDKNFGGLSSLKMQADGANFVMLSDVARWFRGRILYRDGRPVGLADVETAPALDMDGRPLAARGWYDTESLAESDGFFYVGIERANQIVRFNYARDGLLARGQPIEAPAEIKSLPYNRGLECLAAPARTMPLAGALIAVSERGLDPEGNLKSFIVGGQMPGLFAVKRRDDFDVSDCTVTPDADLLLLERRFNWRQGLAMRIRRIPLSQIRPGALIDGAVLIEADLGYQIDNMEGIGVHRAQDGRLVVTLVSDDNFFRLQRTILLQFAIVE